MRDHSQYILSQRLTSPPIKMTLNILIIFRVIGFSREYIRGELPGIA
jgi:hypothetical protein